MHPLYQQAIHAMADGTAVALACLARAIDENAALAKALEDARKDLAATQAKLLELQAEKISAT